MSSGTLETFHRFVTNNYLIIINTKDVLSKQQQKFETYFNEVKKAREHELKQITEHILADRTKLGKEMNHKLDSTLKAERSLFDEELSKLEKKRKKLVDEAEELRAASLEEEKKLKAKNVDLDRKEEALKAKNEKLLKRIAEYNRRIKEMSRGFGFFRNVFRMKQVQNERKVLDEEQTNLVLRIDALRKKWEEIDETFTKEEKERKDKWLQLTTDASAIKAKIDHLNANREQIIQRSAFEKILFARSVKITEPTKNDPKCPRCSMPNSQSAHFCRICAQRLKKDRPDMSGSLIEIAELNQHFENFSAGMKSSQEIIGLLGGLASGLEKFTASISDMLNSQRKYNLKVLSLDVPKQARDYAKNFAALKEKVDKMNKSLHPSNFSSQIDSFITKVFTEEKIKAFFESMGDELSRAADIQW